MGIFVLSTERSTGGAAPHATTPQTVRPINTVRKKLTSFTLFSFFKMLPGLPGWVFSSARHDAIRVN